VRGTTEIPTGSGRIAIHTLEVENVQSMTLCAPVRTNVSTNTSSSIPWINSHFGRIWHSLCPVRPPDREWSQISPSKISAKSSG